MLEEVLLVASPQSFYHNHSLLAQIPPSYLTSQQPLIRGSNWLILDSTIELDSVLIWRIFYNQDMLN